MSRQQVVCVTHTSAMNSKTAKLYAEGKAPEKPDLDSRSRVVSLKDQPMEQPIILCHQTLYVNIAFGQITIKKLAPNRLEWRRVLVDRVAAM